MSDDLHRLRQGSYRLLAAGFDEVAEDFLAIAGDSLAELEGIGLFDYAFGPQLADALVCFAGSDPRELRAAHVELFEIGVRGEVCSLHESAHLGNPRTGETARILAGLCERYGRLGIPATPVGSRLDHLSTELGAMAALCSASVGCSEDQLAALLRHQAEFARDHVLRWAPGLARQLVEIAHHPAYSALGSAALAFLEHERQHLPMLVDLGTATR